MFHDASLATQAKVDPRPMSAVSTGCGLAGLAGLIAWVCVARSYGMDGPFAALTNLLCVAGPMVAWSLAVDKVHRRASTGIDWAHPKPWRETLDVSLTKIAGLWLTWVALAGIYALGRFYWTYQWGGYPFAMWCFQAVAPALFVLSVPYVIWSDRFLVEPKDGAWSFGAWLMGKEPVEHEAIYNHLRSWAVKGFFLAFMLAIVPPGFGEFVRGDFSQIMASPVALANWLITFMFLIDVAFATVGYVLTFRLLDSHIRSASPFAAGWMAALICYPPFTLMADGGPLDYHLGTRGSNGWTEWFAGQPVVLGVIGTTLVALTAIYAWATMSFGFRFSNLTNRGILTHGPYAWSRHPAYLSKNLFWWIATVPFLTTAEWTDGLRACALMAVTAGVYYWRARTEERHLSLDPDYRAYTEWMARNGAVPRLFAWVMGRSQQSPSPSGEGLGVGPASQVGTNSSRTPPRQPLP